MCPDSPYRALPLLLCRGVFWEYPPPFHYRADSSFGRNFRMLNPLPRDRREFLLNAGRAAAALLLGLAGCRHAQKAPLTELPARHSIQSEQLVVLSDFRLRFDHPLIADLAALRREVSESLELKLNGKPVLVYLFSNEEQYQTYLHETYPSLPPRRAYFIGTPYELAVYTYWGERIQEDLRHEFTHGLLHSGLKAVPLWLDEGLAEYFEVVTEASPPINEVSAKHLAAAKRRGWRPGLERLESLNDVSQMTQADYQESWAWVHFMLHSSPETREVLLGYLQELRTTSDPGSLQKRLRATTPALDEHFLSYVEDLTASTSTTARR